MPLHLVTYDITHPRRLRRVARVCERHGRRVQHSVFLMDLLPTELTALTHALARLLDPTTDSVRYVPVCNEDFRLSRALGAAGRLSAEAPCWVV
jgi:CRISPR-associated protein Cas2